MNLLSMLGIDMTEWGLTLVAEQCPNFKLHYTQGEWCLHPDADDPMSYQHQDLSTVIKLTLYEVRAKAEAARLN